MMSAAECKGHGARCVVLAMSPAISIERAAILLAMSRTWAMLVEQTARYEAILTEEGE